MPVFATILFAVWGLPIVLLGIALPLGCLLVLPRLAWFRIHVDEADAAIDQQEIEAARAALLQRIDEPHRRAFEHLQSLVAGVGERLAGDDQREAGLRWLLSNYLTLARRHPAFASTSARMQLMRSKDPVEWPRRPVMLRILKDLEQRTAPWASTWPRWK